MDKTTTLMIRAACMVVVFAPLGWFSVQWFDREAKVKECALNAWNSPHVPGSRWFQDNPPTGKGIGTAFSEPYKKALRKCNKTMPQVWSFR